VCLQNQFGYLTDRSRLLCIKNNGNRGNAICGDEKILTEFTDKKHWTKAA
jgi:hypothetical protein